MWQEKKKPVKCQYAETNILFNYFEQYESYITFYSYYARELILLIVLWKVAFKKKKSLN